MKDKCSRHLIFWCKKTHTQTMFFHVTKSLIKNVSNLRVQMFLFYCQNIVLGRSWISIFDCQGSFETFLVIVIFCWQTVLFLTAYPPRQWQWQRWPSNIILSVRRYTGAGEPRIMNTVVMVPSTTFASARAQARSHDDSLSFVPCVCVAVAMVTLVSGPGSIINQAGPRQRRVASVKCNQSKYTGHRDHWHTGTRCGAQLMAAFTPLISVTL